MVISVLSAVALVALVTIATTAALSATPAPLRVVVLLVVLLVGVVGLLAVGAVEFVGDALRGVGSSDGSGALRDLRVSDVLAVGPLIALGSLGAAVGAVRFVVAQLARRR